MNGLKPWRYWLWFLVALLLIISGEGTYAANAMNWWRYLGSLLTVLGMQVMYWRGGVDARAA